MPLYPSEGELGAKCVARRASERFLGVLQRVACLPVRVLVQALARGGEMTVWVASLQAGHFFRSSGGVDGAEIEAITAREDSCTSC